ncbi:MAG TPA: TIGR04013 family B12-binding domain/radical SAM domain-containing protein [Anaeromyxobacter sp.]|nr:TIGR04013 family B12-binding domain/radical SAM domain-containing protein [Anaeromyxobacter sp.]
MPALVLHYRKTARFALNALLGAVETHPATRDLPAVLASSPGAVADAIGGLRARAPVVVAWSFYTASVAEVTEELARVRAAEPVPALHDAGGPHASADPEGTLRAGFDLVALGEGEETLPALLARLAAGDDPRAGAGLAWLEGGRLRTTGRAPPVELDAFPPCAPRAERIGPLEITRGCSWACRFCQTPFLFRARFRHRSLDSVRRWVRWQVSIEARDLRFLTPSALSYGSDGAGCDLAAVEALLAAARAELGPSRRVFFGTFPSELRPEHVSPEGLALVRRYCDNRTLVVGGQSGSDRLLAAMRRGHDAEAVERAARLAVEAGFVPSVDYVCGLPGETEEDRAATRAQMARLASFGARVHAHAFMPLPGTPWAGEPAGLVAPATGALLDRLAARGGAHGQWRRQEHWGRAMARNAATGEGSG